VARMSSRVMAFWYLEEVFTIVQLTAAAGTPPSQPPGRRRSDAHGSPPRFPSNSAHLA
jgi:hypothetical protein